MSTHPLSLIRAAAAQAAGDLRPALFSPSVIGLLTPAIFLGGVTMYSTGLPDSITWTSGLLTGAIGAFAAYLPMTITSEVYTERVGGALLRVRILPNGPLIWSMGKTMSALTTMGITQLTVLAVTLAIYPDLYPGLGGLLTCLLLILFTSVACAPLGFIIGAFVRGMMSLLIATVTLFGIFITAGGFFPITILPRWAQAIHALVPFYWTGHLTRWALLDAPNPEAEIGGAFQPGLALAILTAWTIIGFVVAAWTVRISFRKESLSMHEKIRSSIRSQAGM